MKNKNSILHFIIPFFIQIGNTACCIALHRLFVSKGSFVCPEIEIGGNITSPTAGRFVFMILATALSVILTILASKFAKKGKAYLPFVLGCFSGTLLWVALGEDSWHFCVGGVNMVRLEDISAFPVFIVFVIMLIILLSGKVLDWGLNIVLLAFAVNWFGHYLLEGLYPFFSGVSSHDYMKIVGHGLGSAIFILGLIIGLLKYSAIKKKMVASILCFFGMALIVFPLFM